jgi:hypothetical protein
LAGWKVILWRTYVRSGEDRLMATAAGVVFFGLLAVLPESSFQIVQDQITRVVDKALPRSASPSCLASGSPSAAPMPVSRRLSTLSMSPTRNGKGADSSD